MTDAEKIRFKNKLKQHGLVLIGQRITAAKEAIAQAQQAANQEEKSSAGDKYETGRAMGHLQKDMHSRQLSEQAKELATLLGVQVDTLYPVVRSGSFIQCEDLGFFMAAGLGKQIMDGRLILFLSPLAPLARSLEGKKTGDSFSLNGEEKIILDLY